VTALPRYSAEVGEEDDTRQTFGPGRYPSEPLTPPLWVWVGCFALSIAAFFGQAVDGPGWLYYLGILLVCTPIVLRQHLRGRHAAHEKAAGDQDHPSDSTDPLPSAR
jgi:hypothetical protein